jgi:hypothetical protein
VSGSQSEIELYVDLCCPSAWIAYQWLAEVRRRRAVALGLHVMSLPMLDSSRPESTRRRSVSANLASARSS